MDEKQYNAFVEWLKGEILQNDEFKNRADDWPEQEYFEYRGEALREVFGKLEDYEKEIQND
jgi:hypothetical protein